MDAQWDKFCRNMANIFEIEYKPIPYEALEYTHGPTNNKVATAYMLEEWNKPDSIYRTPEYKQRNAAMVKELWKNPDYAANRSRHTKSNWQDPEYIANQKDKQSENWLITPPIGEPFMVRNLKAWCTDNGFIYQCIQRVAWGTRRHHHGYRVSRVT
jgi:hypothetical protein